VKDSQNRNDGAGVEEKGEKAQMIVHQIVFFHVCKEPVKGIKCVGGVAGGRILGGFIHHDRDWGDISA
jgi:hypothetical protein